MKELGVYIHIPFCIKKCYYCDFPSFSDASHTIEEYIEALINEIKLWKEQLENYYIKSVFIGGGTPSIVPLKAMCKLVEAIHVVFRIKQEYEMTIESNPNTLDQEKIKCYLDAGINRLSIGLQAWQDNLLKKIGRIHTKDEFLKNYYIARTLGFKNINVDLIFGLPNQTLQQWIETLENVVRINPDHISTYSLKIEEGTPFHQLYETGELHLPSDEQDRDMYHYTIEYLKNNNYQHYEISNFAQKYKECIHNKIYWNNEEYIGFGLGAHSYMNKIRFSNTLDLNTYIKNAKLKQKFRIYEEKKSKEDEIAETMFLRLRMMEGVNIASFKKRFGVSPLQIYSQQLTKLEKLGLLEINDQYIRLTRKGIDLSNQVFVEFLPDK